MTGYQRHGAPKNRTRLVITARGLAVVNAVLAMALLAIVGLVVVGMLNLAVDTVPTRDTLPPCSDAVAEAGGMCEGPLPSDSLPPCETEDSTGCYWDADTMGNRQGSDVVTLRDGVADVTR